MKAVMRARMSANSGEMLKSIIEVSYRYRGMQAQTMRGL